MRSWIVGGALAALLTAGGAGVALAQSNPSPSTTNPPPATSEAPGANQQNQPGSTKDCPGPRRGPRPVDRLLRGAVKASAKVIGIQPKELAQDLKNGQSVADVAKAHNVDPQKVIDTLVTDANARVDEAVKNGNLTQKRADALKKRIPDAVDKFVNHRRSANDPGPGQGGPPPDAQPGQNGGSTPQDTPVPPTTS
jgi:hypothetical protein